MDFPFSKVFYFSIVVFNLFEAHCQEVAKKNEWDADLLLKHQQDNYFRLHKNNECELILFSDKNGSRNAVSILGLEDENLKIQFYSFINFIWEKKIETSVNGNVFGLEIPVDTVIELKDVDFDGMDEILIVINKNEIPYSTYYKCFKWDSIENKYVDFKGFDEIPDPVFDIKSGQFIGYLSDGCADLNFIFSWYSYLGNEFKLVREVNIDACESLESQENKLYLITINGKSSRLNLEDVLNLTTDVYKEITKIKLSE